MRGTWTFICGSWAIWGWIKSFQFVTTVHKDLAERLRGIDRRLYSQARAVLERNKAERHLRGGEATRIKYKGM